MPLFSAYPESTAPDLDDSYLVLVDGVVSRVTGATTKAFALPDGWVDAADYTATTGALIESADTLTGWVGTNLYQVATIGTVTKTQGTGAVRMMMKLQAGVTSKAVFTPSSPVSVAGRSSVAFDVTFFSDGPVHAASHEFEARVADGAGIIAGNINAQSLTGMPYGDPAGDTNAAWHTVVLPLAGLSNITSIGLFRAVTTSGGSSDRVDARIDNVRFLDETKLDVALASAPDAIAVVPPSYTPDTDQLPIYLPDGKGILDPALGVYSKQNNVVWLHDYLAHVVGAETGETDVAAAINRVIMEAPPGSTVRATPGATYRFDNDVTCRDLRDVTIDFTGATCVLTYQTNTQFWSFVLCRNVTLIGGTWLGYYKIPVGGSAMTTVAGTPTNSGFTKLLDAALEEVQIPLHTNWDLYSHYARHLPQQLGLPADGGQPRIYWEFILSDSAQIANDCIISVYDGSTGTLLTSSTLTLTGTPTTYRISYTPTDLRQRYKVTVRKALATANTITITQMIPYGEVKYNVTYDVASCFILQYSSYIKILDTWVEGFGGDAVQISDQTVNHVEYRNSYSRGCRRQGASFNQGTDFLIENCVFAETGRSGLDFEPFGSDWYTKRVTVRNNTFYNTINYNFAMGNWARNFDYLIDGVDSYESRLGVFFGGFRGGTIQNLRNWAQFNYGSTLDYDFTGQNMTIRNVRSKQGTQLHTTTSTWDDGTGIATFTPSGNLVDSRSFTIVSGTGIGWVAGYRDLNADLFLAANTGAAYTATRTALRQDFLLTNTANTTITLAGGNLLNNEVSVWNIVFKQDATGGRTIAVTGVTWPGGAPTFVTTALASNHCSFVQYGAGPIYGYYGGSATT